jgi:hypothetical protein
MHAAEAADTISETAEDLDREAHLRVIEEHEHRERFRSRAALVIAVLAALLAICELAGDNAKNSMIDNNIRASDSWAFYQAKNVRQTEFKLAADQLKRELAQPNLAPGARAAIQADAAKYDKTVARYEDDPSATPNDPLKGGEGKKQLQARAKFFEEARDRDGERHELYDLAVMLLQLGIVLGSVSILATSRPLLWLSGLLGLGGIALLADGFLLLVPLRL